MTGPKDQAKIQEMYSAPCWCGRRVSLNPSFDRETGRVNGWSMKCSCGISFTAGSQMKTVAGWNKIREEHP